MMIRCFEIDDWCFGCGLLVTCYSCSLSLCDSVNCRVVWGLDHKAGDLCGWLLIVDGFGWKLA